MLHISGAFALLRIKLQFCCDYRIVECYASCLTSLPIWRQNRKIRAFVGIFTKFSKLADSRWFHTTPLHRSRWNLARKCAFSYQISLESVHHVTPAWPEKMKFDRSQNIGGACITLHTCHWSGPNLACRSESVVRCCMPNVTLIGIYSLLQG